MSCPACSALAEGQEEILKVVKGKEMECPSQECPPQPQKEELIADMSEVIEEEGRKIMSNQTSEIRRDGGEIRRKLQDLGEAIDRSDSSCGKKSDDLKSSLSRKIDSSVLSASALRVAVAEGLREGTPTLDEIERAVGRIVTEHDGLSDADVARVGEEVAARFQRATSQHELKVRQETKSRMGSLKKAVDANWKKTREAFERLVERSGVFQEKVASRMDVTSDEARSIAIAVHGLYDAIVKLEARFSEDVDRLNTTLLRLRVAVEEVQEDVANQTDLSWVLLLLDKLESELASLRDRDLGDSLYTSSYQNSNYSQHSLLVACPVLLALFPSDALGYDFMAISPF